MFFDLFAGSLIFFAFARCEQALVVDLMPVRLRITRSEGRSHCVFFSDYDCDLVYRNKWVVQNSMEVFTLCDCDNITYYYVAHCEQKTNRSRNQKKIGQCERALQKRNPEIKLRNTAGNTCNYKT